MVSLAESAPGRTLGHTILGRTNNTRAALTMGALIAPSVHAPQGEEASLGPGIFESIETRKGFNCEWAG
eukprot:CAMPEP_0173218396 /NCGR_PEP_ID=MMETSP1142-20121109/1028_1 /TAXON_ID=483371 /ORGANISM="non described non described, Strain CCMP2298" /LENGTH=68 /DNA_ID=CAMNT_0014146083 /DNA_START=192 /DNA_END=395 /DNA_ORIENTATION=-